jgi:hypothetical protein
MLFWGKGGKWWFWVEKSQAKLFLGVKLGFVYVRLRVLYIYVREKNWQWAVRLAVFLCLRMIKKMAYENIPNWYIRLFHTGISNT